MYAGMICGQRSNAAMLGGNGKDVTAGFYERTRRRRGERVAADGLLQVLEFRARLDVLGVHHDREIPRLAAGEIVFAERAAIFIHDGVGPDAGPLDVVLLVVG